MVGSDPKRGLSECGRRGHGCRVGSVPGRVASVASGSLTRTRRGPPVEVVVPPDVDPTPGEWLGCESGGLDRLTLVVNYRLLWKVELDGAHRSGLW